MVKADVALCNADTVVWLMAVSAGNPAEERSLSHKPVDGTASPLEALVQHPVNNFNYLDQSKGQASSRPVRLLR